MNNTELSNLAIGHLGTGKEIGDFDTDTSQEARACRRFLIPAKEITLREVAWPFANRCEVLSLVEENPTDEWQFSYRYPSDAIRVLRIPLGILQFPIDTLGRRIDTVARRAVFKLAKDASGQLIYTNEREASMEYTENVTNNGLFTIDFELALSFLLATYIAPQISGADPFKMGTRALELYRLHIGMARDNAFNEEQNERQPESEFTTGRD